MTVTITLDLEDETGRNSPDGRWVEATDRFLAALAGLGVRATVFVVGEAAAANPGLVRRVVAAGHEVGLHGMRHVTLATSGRALARELSTGRALLQDMTGTEVAGFRAPIFSLTPATAWAVEAISECGFTYSSSILPAHNPLHGWPGLPDTPFSWSTGLVELPCPVLGRGRARIPFLGGIYLRYVPPLLTRRALSAAPPDAVLWSYVHPYDLDPGAPLQRFPHANWPTSLLLHTRRRSTMPRLRWLMDQTGGAGAPLVERVADLRTAGLPEIDATA